MKLIYLLTNREIALVICCVILAITAITCAIRAVQMHDLLLISIQHQIAYPHQPYQSYETNH